MPSYGQRNQSLARCPHKAPDGVPCDANLSPGLFAPDGWNVYTLPLEQEQDISPHGYMKRCPRCNRPVELVIRNESAA